jgi:hypothetical protein
MPEEDIALVQAREELKSQLAAGEYQTLVDAVLMGMGRLIQKITRRSRPLPKWFSVVVLMVMTYALGLGLIVIAGDLSIFYKFSGNFGPGGGLIMWLTGLMPFIILLLIDYYIHRILALWWKMMLDATESVASIVDFRKWLVRACDQRLQLVVAIAGGIALGAYLMVVTNTLVGHIGFGIAVFTCVVGMFGALFVFLVFVAVDLSLRLRRYELRLFAADPSASEVISRLSGLLSLGVYLTAAYFALLTFIVASGGLLPTFAPILIMLWLPIIAMFVLNQTSLASIIRRVKWKTLNGIQAQVAALQTAENYSSQETMEAINRLLDYHDRVKDTRGSALDLRATLNFLNSLLLPLVGFLLAKVDRVLAIFRPPP